MELTYNSDAEPGYQYAGNVLSRFADIHTFIFDVDGVLTNSQLLITESGELLRSMSAKDGYAMRKAVDSGYRMLIITGGKSAGVIKRLNDLGISDIIWGVQNKLKPYEEYLDAMDIDESGILFLGDDIPDLPVMKRVGLAACPCDAVPEVKRISHYVSPIKGGEGCVRDVIEKVMKLRGHWE
jgi:3-deoxy-D-manno-octulosonate 8-phosphate phosphatase (KDO 8-P phosphatase)